jgi:GNAT superfamily N-acetyltransferase
MYFEYLKERQKRMSLTHEFGFATFDLGPEGELYIADMYVRPEKRGSGIVSELVQGLEQLAKQFQKTYLSCRIYVKDKGADRTLGAAQKLGFRVRSAEGGCIILTKDLED